MNHRVRNDLKSVYDFATSLPLMIWPVQLKTDQKSKYVHLAGQSCISLVLYTKKSINDRVTHNEILFNEILSFLPLRLLY